MYLQEVPFIFAIFLGSCDCFAIKFVLNPTEKIVTIVASVNEPEDNRDV